MEIFELLTELLRNKKWQELKELLTEMNEQDIAELFMELEERDLTLIYRLLPKELAAEVFVNMEPEYQELLIRAFSDTELREVLDELYVDDAVDLIEEMPATLVKRILKHTDPDTRKSINEILRYPEDSAGSLMTIEYVDLKRSMTVADAFTRIRRTGVDKETIYTCYVTDSKRKLKGYVTVKDLLLADENALALALSEEEIENLAKTQAKAALVPLGVNFEHITTIEVERPRLAMMKLLHLFYDAPDAPVGIHPSAVIHPEAKLGEKAVDKIISKCVTSVSKYTKDGDKLVKYRIQLGNELEKAMK